mgnify:CR=1 FL=1
MINDSIKLFVDPLIDIWNVFVSYIPTVIAAIFFLLLGLFLARVIRSALEQFFKRVKLDRYTSKIGLNELLARFGMGKSPSYAICFAAYWVILLMFFVSALNIINLTIISEILQKVMVHFVPKIIVAIMVAFGGLMFARFMAEIVLNSSIANNLKGGKSLSKIVNFVILVFTAIVSLDQLGIEMKIIRSSINIFLGSIGLAFAIAVGMGAKDVAREIIQGMFTAGEKESKN